MAFKALVVLGLAFTFSSPAWPQAAADPLAQSSGDPYDLILHDPMALPKLDEFDRERMSDAERPGEEAAHAGFASPRSMNPYFATPADLSGAGGASADRSAADVYGSSATLNPLGGPRPDRPRPGTASTGRLPSANLYPNPAASAEGLNAKSVESEDPTSPKADAYGPPAPKRARTLNGDPLGLLGFNPYDAKSIVGPSRLRPPAPSDVGAVGKTSSPGSLNASLPSSLPSSLASPLVGKPLR